MPCLSNVEVIMKESFLIIQVVVLLAASVIVLLQFSGILLRLSH